LEHKPNIIHFSGHGEQAGIMLENEAGESHLIDGDTLANFLEPLSGQTECVILNACFTALQASAIVRYVDFVIGMNQPIYDNAAIQFAVGFYDALAAGESIPTAFKWGRTNIQGTMPNYMEHLKPVLKQRFTNPHLHLPIMKNRLFTGRQTILHQLQETLHFDHLVTLSGLGGIGKTQTAAHYARLHQHEYKAVLWCLADTVTSLRSELVAIASELDGLPENLSRQDSIKAVKNWLATNDHWLLILDNVDDIKVVAELTVLAKENRHIILTTRAIESRIKALIINEMSRKEGIAFLLCRILEQRRNQYGEIQDHSVTDKKIAGQLVDILGALPLALDQAGAYIRETQCGLAGYLDEYQKHKYDLLKERGSLLDDLDHSDSVAITWLLSFSKIEVDNPTAIEVLKLCAFLSPDSIPEEIFQDIKLNDALKVILRYSFVQRNPNKILTIHRLVQEVLRYDMDEKEQRSWAKKAVVAVDSVLPHGDIVGDSKLPTYERLLPCAQTCVKLIKEWKIESKAAGDLLNQTHEYLFYKGDYKLVQPLCEQSLAIREKLFGQEHQDVATSLYNLGVLDHNQNDYDSAEQRLKQSLNIREKVFGHEHSEVAASLLALGVLYNTKGKYDLAKKSFEDALSIYEKVPSQEHNVANCLSGLADFYYNRENYKEAEQLYKRALEINGKVFGQEDSNVANILIGLASLYHSQGHYEKTEQLYKRALEINRKVFGQEHPNVANTFSALAELYRTQNNYDEAEQLFKQSLAICKKVFGQEHSTVANSFEGLANLYHDQAKYDLAKQSYERALDICKKIFGQEHLEVAKTINNLANLYDDQGNSSLAEKLYKDALAIGEKIYGQEHSFVATTLNNLATLHHNQNNYGEAKQLYERALAINEKLFGEKHPSVAININNLAKLCYHQDDYDEAKQLYERALAINEEIYGQEHSEVAVNLDNLAELFNKQGHYKSARPLCQRALDIEEKFLGQEHPSVAISLNHLAESYRIQGDYDSAKPLYERAIGIAKKNKLKPDHPKVLLYSENYAKLLEEMKKATLKPNK